jgi:hypothetical protein
MRRGTTSPVGILAARLSAAENFHALLGLAARFLLKDFQLFRSKRARLSRIRAFFW